MFLLACSTPVPVDTSAVVAPLDSSSEVADSAVSDTGDGCVDARDLSWESFGHGFFRTWCTSCHGEAAADRNGAPPGVDFDTEAQVETWVAAIRRTVIDDATMPKGGGVYDEDLALLDEYLRCGLGGGEEAGGSPSSPKAALTADEVGATIDTLFALGLPDATTVVETYMSMFRGRDSSCPGNDGYSLPGNFRGCQTAGGWIYAGVAGLDYLGSGSELSFDLWADCWISDDDGAMWIGAGDVEYNGTWADGEATWETELAGTFGYEASSTAWIAEVPSMVFSSAGRYGDGWEMSWSGSFSSDNEAVYLDQVSWTSTCPAGEGRVLLRGEDAYWYVVDLDACTGCGSVSFEGSQLGTTCVELAAAGADLLARSLPGDEP